MRASTWCRRPGVEILVVDSVFFNAGAILTACGERERVGNRLVANDKQRLILRREHGCVLAGERIGLADRGGSHPATARLAPSPIASLICSISSIIESRPIRSP